MVVRRARFTGMRGIAPVPSYVVMQPTTLCNLDCAYCYLPFRSADRRMPVGVAAAVAGPVNRWAARRPLLGGLARRRAAGRRPGALRRPARAVRPGVEHHVQTNATLIDDAWCEFFAAHEMRVSVSVDGPRERNGDRVTRGGRPAYDRIVRGIETLRRARHRLLRPLRGLRPRAGPGRRALRLLPRPGLRRARASTSRRTRASTPAATPTRRAGRRLLGRAGRRLAAGPADPRPGDRVGAALRRGGAGRLGRRACCPASSTRSHRRRTTARWSLLSPELAGFSDPRLRRLQQRQRADDTRLPRSSPVRRSARPGSPSSSTAWRRAGRPARTSASAAVRHAANRYFEHGRFDATETDHCRNSKIRLLEGVLEHARDHQPSAA